MVVALLLPCVIARVSFCSYQLQLYHVARGQSWAVVIVVTTLFVLFVDDIMVLASAPDPWE